MQKKCLAVLTVAATLSLASNSFAALAGANTVNSAAIIDGQVKTADLATGAVTDAKITGPISTGKLSVGVTSGTVAAGNHNHDGIYQRKYGNVIVVATSGGEYDNPMDAINDINAWCQDRSSSHSCLMKIMPGVYDVGASALNIPSYVGIEGAGADETVLTSSGSTTVHINYAEKVAIRDITIENSATAGSTALQSDFSTFSIKNAVVKSANAAGTSYKTAIFANLSDAVIDNVKVSVSGPASTSILLRGIGIYYGSSARISNSEVTVGNTDTVSGGTLEGISCASSTNSDSVVKISGTDVSLSGAGINSRGIFAANSGNYVAKYDLDNVDVNVNGFGGSKSAFGLWVEKAAQGQGLIDINIRNSRFEASGQSTYFVSSTGGDSINVNAMYSDFVNNNTDTYAIFVGNGTNANVSTSRIAGNIFDQNSSISCFGNFDANNNPVTCP